RDSANAVAKINQKQQHNQRDKNDPHPQVRQREDQRGGKRDDLVGTWFDKNDCAADGDEPDEQALHRQKTRSGRYPRVKFRSGRIVHRHTLLTPPGTHALERKERPDPHVVVMPIKPGRLSTSNNANRRSRSSSAAPAAS